MFPFQSCSLHQDNKNRLKASEDWLRDYLGFVKSMRRYTKGHDDVNVKIAILDTGIDDDHPYVKSRWNASRNNYCNFVVDGADQFKPRDDDGHGTHCAGLILRFAPGVSLYVARITSSKEHIQEDNELPLRVAQVC